MERQVVVFVLVLCFLVGGMPTRVEVGGVYATEFTQLLNHYFVGVLLNRKILIG